MDKQKQIEGIARAMCGNFRKGVKGDNLCGQLALKCDCKCKHIARAENLYNAGYRKIPENAVVLTREQYEKDLAIERELGERKASRARKETAEKFAGMLKEYINDRCCEELGDMACDTDYYTIDIPKTFDKIDEICKELTEGKV
jgi:hypothetical protein